MAYVDLKWPSFKRTVKTSTYLFILRNLIGNKAAHSYFGNTQKAKWTPKYPCTACGKAVTLRSKAISCDLCDNWTHTKCTGSISNEKYDEMVKKILGFFFSCNSCISQSLPFHNQISITNETEKYGYIENQQNSISEDQSKTLTNEYKCFKSRGLHLVSLNIRSLLPKIDQLKLFAQSNNPTAVSISETWLDDSITQNEIQIPGYSIERKDRNRNGAVFVSM